MLGYGVTTIRDPHTGSQNFIGYADRVALGNSVGPRVFTTLMPLQKYRPLDTLTDMRAFVRPYAEFYDTENIKNKLNRGRRAQQLLAIAASEAGLLVDNEGYNDTQIQLTYLIDGFMALEHGYPTIPLYEDILRLLAASGAYQTFTLSPQGGDEYYMRKYDYLGSFPHAMFELYPTDQLHRLATSLSNHVDTDAFHSIAQQPARLIAAGGHVGMGSHGDIPGIGYHFEMWAHALGGMRNHDVLRAATLWSAEAIGHSVDLGSIEVGKLADLDVLDADPLEDIHNTLTLKWIVKNGRFYQPYTSKPLVVEGDSLSQQPARDH